MKLIGYFRSGASYRVRIALNLKGIQVEHAFRHLRKGEQKAEDYLKINPQGLVPALVLDDGTVLTQSLAIMEWLEETVPQPPLLPKDPIARAKVRAFAEAIACDVHPVQNLGPLNKLAAFGVEQAEVTRWAKEVNYEGLKACEALIANEKGPFCFGDQPTMADICLVPQLVNARRFGADISAFKRILEAEAASLKHPAFAAAVPEKQPDAE
ncbi:MAG TPA: maleylacetoacetate isomerase [Beijerinckiaceae bacterium]|jgi:maleylpyruvate isomerase|nr:maleylacetoacetate isomerase [Beijerinckiaceae bacterium]